MYSENEVARRIAIAEDEVGFRLQYHSPSDIDSFDSLLASQGKLIYDARGMATGVQSLTADDARFIENEQTLAQCDHAYGLTRYCFVKDETNVIHRFSLRIAQRILFELIAELEDEGAAIEILILKARQLGMSTLVELLIALRIVFGYGINAVVASAEQEKSGLMAKMLFLAYDRMPVWLKPTATARSEEGDQKKLIFGQNNTVLSIQHGKKMTGGIAQGWTPTIYHISEAALFPNPEVQIDDGLWKAVHASPAVLGFIETTGAGDIGWLPKTWQYSKANWPTRTCRMRPVFLPWFCGLDIYPTPTWTRMRSTPRGWYERRLPDTREHVAKAEAFAMNNPVLRRHLCTQHPELGPARAGWWADGHMPIEQQYFWEVGFQEARAKGRESTWFQEMAGDDIEALQRSAEGVFGHDVIVEIGERRQREVAVYGLAGEAIESHHEPDTADIDYARERIVLPWTAPRGDTYRWELIPLAHAGPHVESLRDTNVEAFKEYAWGRFFVWHPPRAGVDYAIGVDTSNGIGQDSTSISVCELGASGMPDVQAAEFTSPYVSHTEAYVFAAVIAAYYARAMTESAQRQPLMVIEQIAAVGDTCQLQMRRSFGFTRFHKFQRLDGVQVAAKNSKKLGWYSNAWSRPILVGGIVDAIRNHWYIPNSPWLIHECAHMEQHLTKAGKAKQEHSDGENDDRVISAALSSIPPHLLDSAAERSSRRFMGPLESSPRPMLDFSPCAQRIDPNDPRRDHVSLTSALGGVLG